MGEGCEWSERTSTSQRDCMQDSELVKFNQDHVLIEPEGRTELTETTTKEVQAVSRRTVGRVH